MAMYHHLRRIPTAISRQNRRSRPKSSVSSEEKGPSTMFSVDENPLTFSCGGAKRFQPGPLVLQLATVIWALLELLEYNLLALLCHLSILALALLFLWSSAATFIHK